MKKRILGVLLPILFLFSGCSQGAESQTVLTLADVPAFSGEPYVVIDDNEPHFPEADFTSKSFEQYSELDALGRCGPAYANVGIETMPTEKRGNISQVKPTGWQSIKYDFVDGKSLYNRCHLIGFQLTAENANKKNLITGTRYMNVDGMLPFENMVADYVKETKNHVLYRVTPIFEGDNLVASGVQMEAKSVEDDGAGIEFHVYVYNNQPGVTIDYATGESWEEGQTPVSGVSGKSTYLLNTSTQKFHKEDCASVKSIGSENKKKYQGSRKDLIADGYTACGQCKP